MKKDVVQHDTKRSNMTKPTLACPKPQWQTTLSAAQQRNGFHLSLSPWPFQFHSLRHLFLTRFCCLFWGLSLSPSLSLPDGTQDTHNGQNATKEDRNKISLCSCSDGRGVWNIRLTPSPPTLPFYTFSSFFFCFLRFYLCLLFFLSFSHSN